MPTQPKNNNWTITISPESGGFGGFVPSWFKNTWPSFGNKNQAADMKNIDLEDPNVLTQGPAPIDLTNGSEAGVVTTLITSILKTVAASNVTYAVGGAIVYKLNATTVSNTSPYPQTIDKSVVTGETATDLIFYHSNLYTFYNHSGNAGDIAKITLSTDVLDPDWGSTVPTGATTLVSAPHYAILAGDDVVYFTNGQYIATISGTTLDDIALDFPDDAQVISLAWSENRVIAAVNRPNITGSNFNQSGIFRWNGVTSSWEGDPVDVPGLIGALYAKNGIIYVWWQDGDTTNGYWFGYINGTQLGYLRRYKGTLPNQPQVGEHNGFITWISNGLIYKWGSNDASVPVNLFQYGSPKYTTTIGAIAAPFGSLLVASHNATTGYSLAALSGYSVDSNYKLKVEKVCGIKYKSSIDIVQVETEQLASGAKADFTITYNKGKASTALDQIAYSSANKTFHKILTKGISNVEDFRLDISFANGSAINPVKIRSIQIGGHYIPNP